MASFRIKLQALCIFCQGLTSKTQTATVELSGCLHFGGAPFKWCSRKWKFHVKAFNEALSTVDFSGQKHKLCFWSLEHRLTSENLLFQRGKPQVKFYGELLGEASSNLNFCWE
jgi:hypothetical protein